MSLDARIEQLKEQISATRSQRLRSRDEHCAFENELRETNDVLGFRIRGIARRGNGLRFYTKVMEQICNINRTPAVPYVCKLEGMLLEASHKLEVLNKYVERVQRQNESIANYMRCEISVMEDEKTSIETEFQNLKASKFWAQQQLQRDFCQREIPQHMVLQRLHAVIKLKSSSMPLLLASVNQDEQEGRSIKTQPTRELNKEEEPQDQEEQKGQHRHQETKQQRRRRSSLKDVFTGSLPGLLKQNKVPQGWGRPNCEGMRSATRLASQAA